jgi:hypothetical protein
MSWVCSLANVSKGQLDSTIVLEEAAGSNVNVTVL